MKNTNILRTGNMNLDDRLVINIGVVFENINTDGIETTVGVKNFSPLRWFRVMANGKSKRPTQFISTNNGIVRRFSIVRWFRMMAFGNSKHPINFIPTNNGIVGRFSIVRWFRMMAHGKTKRPIKFIPTNNGVFNNIKMFILNSVDEEIQSLKDELEAIKLQKKGLMQQLLTGKIRVKI